MTTLDAGLDALVDAHFGQTFPYKIPRSVIFSYFCLLFYQFFPFGKHFLTLNFSIQIELLCFYVEIYFVIVWPTYFKNACKCMKYIEKVMQKCDIVVRNLYTFLGIG